VTKIMGFYCLLLPPSFITRNCQAAAIFKRWRTVGSKDKMRKTCAVAEEGGYSALA
jgi:hypothetical protein